MKELRELKVKHVRVEVVRTIPVLFHIVATISSVVACAWLAASESFVNSFGELMLFFGLTVVMVGLMNFGVYAVVDDTEGYTKTKIEHEELW